MKIKQQFSLERPTEERKKRFIKEVKDIYGKEVKVDYNVQYEEVGNYFYSRFKIEKSDKTLSFMCREHQVNEPFALSYSFENVNDLIAEINNFKKGA